MRLPGYAHRLDIDQGLVTTQSRQYMLLDRVVSRHFDSWSHGVPPGVFCPLECAETPGRGTWTAQSSAALQRLSRHVSGSRRESRARGNRSPASSRCHSLQPQWTAGYRCCHRPAAASRNHAPSTTTGGLTEERPSLQRHCHHSPGPSRHSRTDRTPSPQAAGSVQELCMERQVLPAMQAHVPHADADCAACDDATTRTPGLQPTQTRRAAVDSVE